MFQKRKSLIQKIKLIRNLKKLRKSKNHPKPNPNLPNPMTKKIIKKMIKSQNQQNLFRNKIKTKNKRRITNLQN